MKKLGAEAVPGSHRVEMIRAAIQDGHPTWNVWPWLAQQERNEGIRKATELLREKLSARHCNLEFATVVGFDSVHSVQKAAKAGGLVICCINRESHDGAVEGLLQLKIRVKQCASPLRISSTQVRREFRRAGNLEWLSAHLPPRVLEYHIRFGIDYHLDTPNDEGDKKKGSSHDGGTAETLMHERLDREAMMFCTNSSYDILVTMRPFCSVETRLTPFDPTIAIHHGLRSNRKCRERETKTRRSYGVHQDNSL